MENLSDYNIEKFIEKAREMTFADLYTTCNQHYENLNGRKISNKRENRDGEYTINQYKDFLHQVLYMFNHGSKKPGGMSEDRYLKMKEIIESRQKESA